MDFFEKDLFGHEVLPIPPKNGSLREVFLEPPFSVLNSRSYSWRLRKKKWNNIGLSSLKGRQNNLTYDGLEKYGDQTSIFDPVLCELMYHWFCRKKGNILDPFAGGSVRGIVASYLGFNYTGLELREEQVLENRKQANTMELENHPVWVIGDSNKTLENISKESFDFVFSCPPYAFLEKYSDLPDDLSNMDYSSFLEIYEQIIFKSCNKLKNGGFACFVVGEIRDKKGNYVGFVPDTIKAFQKANVEFYNEAILLNAIGSAPIRAAGYMKNKKLVKLHQNILIFKKY